MPTAVGLDQGYQRGKGFFAWDVLFYQVFATVYAHASASCAYIAVVGIGHFARPVHHASHHSDFEVFQMAYCGFHFLERRREVEERASAARACDEFRLAEAQACGLQDCQLKPVYGCLLYTSDAADER